MLVREHVYVFSRCVFCPAQQGDARLCAEREDGFQPGDICRDVGRRVPACEDVTILARMAEIREDAKPRCPVTPTRTLESCLKTISQCGNHCPHRDDWTGPDGENAAAGSYC